MVGDSGPALHRQMAQSGSSIKLRGMGGPRGNHNYEGQAVKQKVFSLPKDVNGVTSITQSRPQDPNFNDLSHDQSAAVLGPLVLNNAGNPNQKRHTSVEPNAM